MTYPPVWVDKEACEVWPRVWMGGVPESYEGFDLVVSAEQYRRYALAKSFDNRLIHVPLIDDDEILLPDGSIETAVETIESAWQSGAKILVHCTGGLNRSGVVVGEWLKLRGLTGREAVDLIRAKRSEHALCNRYFERYVTGEKLPTAETTTFVAP